MSRSLASWEKDPFFHAAEQVQDSADRLESAYRALIHAKSLPPDAQGKGSIDFYRRELGTAFGIARWQLEEFEKEVSMLSPDLHVEDEVPHRHQQFVEAISYQLSSIRNCLLSSKDQKDRKILTSVSLGQKESDELAHFLCGSQMSVSNMGTEMLSGCSKAEMRYNEAAMSASLFSTSSGMDGRKGMSGSLDERSSYQETCTSSNANDHGLSIQTRILEDNSANTKNLHTDMDTYDSDRLATRTLLCEDCNDDVNMRIESVHAQSWTGIGLNGGVGCYNDAGDSKIRSKHLQRGFFTHTWPSFLRPGLCFGSGVSQSVLKRLKDGESDPLDLCQMCDDDIEANCGRFLCQRFKGSSELPTFWSSQKIALTRPLVQRIIMALAVIVIFYLCLY